MLDDSRWHLVNKAKQNNREAYEQNKKESQ